MTLSERHQRFLFIEQGAVPTVFNFALNGAIAWALFRSVEAVPLWGESSVGVDLLATAFLLPFLTCLIVSAIVARHVRAVATYLRPEGKLYRFKVEAFDDAGPIGSGEHTRAIVATDRLLAGAAKRKP